MASDPGGDPVLQTIPGLFGQDLVNGQFTTIHTAVRPNYGNQVNNDSGITTNGLKVLSMPGYYDWWPCEPYDELFDDDRSQATIHWMGPWSNRLLWKDWVLGYTTVVGGGAVLSTGGASPTPTNPVSLSRIVPHQHPEMPWLYATDCKFVKGCGAIYNRDDLVVLSANGNPALGPDNLGAFDPMLAYGEPSPPGAPWGDGKCIYAVTYRALDFDVLTDGALLASPYAGSELGRYVTRLVKPGIKALGLPASSKLLFKIVPFSPDPLNISGQIVSQGEIPVYQPMAQLEYIWHDVPVVPWNTLAQCIGTVNSVQFDPVGAAPSNGMFPLYPGTCLCQAPQVFRYRTRAGRRTYRLTLRFDWLLNGWNYFPCGDGQYHYATFGGTATGRPLYQSTDFNQIFVVSNT